MCTFILWTFFDRHKINGATSELANPSISSGHHLWKALCENNCCEKKVIQ